MKNKIKIFSFIFFLFMISIFLFSCAKTFKIKGDLDHLKLNVKIEKDSNNNLFANITEGTTLKLEVDRSKIDKNKKFIKAYYQIGSDTKTYPIDIDKNGEIIIPGTKVIGDVLVKFVYEEYRYSEISISKSEKNISEILSFSFDNLPEEYQAKNNLILDSYKLKNENGKTLYREGLFGKVNLANKQKLFRGTSLSKIKIDGKFYQDGDIFEFKQDSLYKKDYTTTLKDNEKINPILIKDINLEENKYLNIEVLNCIKSQYEKNKFYLDDEIEINISKYFNHAKNITGLKINGQDFVAENNLIKLKLDDNILVKKADNSGYEEITIIPLTTDKELKNIIYDNNIFNISEHYDERGNRVIDDRFYQGDTFKITLKNLSKEQRLLSIKLNNDEVLTPLNLKNQSFQSRYTVNDKDLEFVAKIVDLFSVNVKIPKAMRVNIKGSDSIYENEIISIKQYETLVVNINTSDNIFSTNLKFKNILLDGAFYNNLLHFEFTPEYVEGKMEYVFEIETINISDCFKLEISDYYADKDQKSIINNSINLSFYEKNSKIIIRPNDPRYFYKEIKVGDKTYRNKDYVEIVLDKNYEIKIRGGQVEKKYVFIEYENFYENNSETEFNNFIKHKYEINGYNLINHQKNKFIDYSKNNKSQLIFYLEKTNYNDKVLKLGDILIYDFDGNLIKDRNILNKIIDYGKSNDIKLVINLTSDIAKIEINKSFLLVHEKLTINFESDDNIKPNLILDNIEPLLIFEENKKEYEVNLIENSKLTLKIKSPYKLLKYKINDTLIEFSEDNLQNQIIIDLNKKITLNFLKDSFEAESIKKQFKINSKNPNFNVVETILNDLGGINLFTDITKPRIELNDKYKDYLYIDDNNIAHFVKITNDEILVIFTASKDGATHEFEVYLSIDLEINSFTLNKEKQINFETLSSADKFKDKSKRKISYEAGAKNSFIIYNSISYFIYDKQTNSISSKQINDQLELVKYLKNINYEVFNKEKNSILSEGYDYELEYNGAFNFERYASKMRANLLDRTVLIIKFDFLGKHHEVEFILVNDGINVYTQKQAYELTNEDKEVYLILHNNLNLVMREDQIDRDNLHPDYANDPRFNEATRKALAPYSKTPTLRNIDESSYFYRNNGNYNYTFNGNFFVLDAKNTLNPLVQNSWSNFAIADPQPGVFLFTQNTGINVLNKVKNTKIVANSGYPDETKPSGIPLWGSGGIYCVRAIFSKIEIDNCDFSNASNSIHARFNRMKITNTSIDNNFSASVFYSNGYSASAKEKIYNLDYSICELENNFFGKSAATAISVIDGIENRRGAYSNNLFIPDDPDISYLYERKNSGKLDDGTFGIYDLIPDYHKFVDNLTKAQREKFVKNPISESDYIISYNADPTVYYKDITVENYTDGSGGFFKSFGIDAKDIIAQVAKEGLGKIDDFLVNANLNKSHVNPKGEVNLVASFLTTVIGHTKAQSPDVHFNQAVDFYYWGNYITPKDPDNNNFNIQRHTGWIRAFRGANHRYGKGEGKIATSLQDVITSIPAIAASPSVNLIDIYTRFQDLIDNAQNLGLPSGVIDVLNNIQTKQGIMGGAVYVGLTGNKIFVKDLQAFGAVANPIINSLFSSYKVPFNLDHQLTFENNDLNNSFLELMPGEFDIGNGKVPIAASIFIGVFNNKVPDWMLN